MINPDPPAELRSAATVMTVSVASASLSIGAAAEDGGGGREDPASQQRKRKQQAASLERCEPGWGPQDSGQGGGGWLQEATHHGSQASWKLFQQVTALNMLVTCLQETHPRRSWVRRPGPSPR